jgi:CRP-like cAMP-binding protein
MSKIRSLDRGSASLVELLGRVGLFAGLPKKTLQLVADMCRQHEFDAGDVIVTEGERSSRFYMIVDGGVEVRRQGQRVGALGPGQYFGEYAVIDKAPRSATVIATTPVRAYSLASIALRPLLKEEPEITYRLLLNACQRLRTLEGIHH